MRLKIIALFCLFTLAGISAWGIDLTGTWEGKQVCQYFDGRKSVVVGDDVLQVSQNGDDLYFSSELVDTIFHARVIEDDRHPSTKAQAIFVECGTTESSSYQELGRATKLQTKSKGSGLFEGTSNFFQIDDDQSRFMGSCNWTYRRVDTEDPNILACSQAAQRVPKAGRQKKSR